MNPAPHSQLRRNSPEHTQEENGSVRRILQQPKVCLELVKLEWNFAGKELKWSVHQRKETVSERVLFLSIEKPKKPRFLGMERAKPYNRSHLQETSKPSFRIIPLPRPTELSPHHKTPATPAQELQP